jgi:branched-chain amino acid transport system substrate-binding protein
MKRLNLRHSFALALLFALIVPILAACGGSEGGDTTTTAGSEATTTTAATAETTTTAAPDEGLGSVTVAAGEAIQIRSLEAISGDVSTLGIPNQNSTQLAIADYGQIQGHDVTFGTGLDDLCSADGGQAAASQIVADAQVVGVIGTSCSGAAAGAMPLISDAGLVMISPSNTSPSLTSDLAGTAAENYFRR